LKQTLVSTKNDPVYNTFRNLGINPYSVLFDASFRPRFAEDRSTEEGKLYEDALEFVIREIGLDNLNKI
ncbi:hypothetical protein, partial [Umezakia ovalisporum]|uniref:hypothetical protein n=1 Tax=Umezakia ovalisporum TaxID=75695 RepID=UPI0039C6024D